MTSNVEYQRRLTLYDRILTEHLAEVGMQTTSKLIADMAAMLDISVETSRRYLAVVRVRNSDKYQVVKNATTIRQEVLQV